MITPVEEKARWKAFSRLPRPAGEPVPGFFTHRPQVCVECGAECRHIAYEPVVGASKQDTETVCGMAEHGSAGWPRSLLLPCWYDSMGRRQVLARNSMPLHGVFQLHDTKRRVSDIRRVARRVWGPDAA